MQPAPALTFCLAEPGAQYIVFSDRGLPFGLAATAPELSLGAAAAAAPRQFNLTWFDPVTGASTAGGKVTAAGGAKPAVQLTPPKAGQHWVALLVALLV